MKPHAHPSSRRRFPLDRLMAWWDRHHRALPWREGRTPWRTWVSEVMLQQTRVETVIPYFTRFMEIFPSPARLAAADPDTLMKTWEGLGYYQRARNLQRGAARVMEEYGGRIPGNPREFATLPGAGPYVTAAVMSMAFGCPLPAVDGNVLRVLARYTGSSADIRRPALRGRARRMLSRIIPVDRPGDFNEALMELGALICRPRRPDCPACPLAEACRARRLDLTERLPVRSRREHPREIEAAVALLFHGERILVRRRPPGGHLGGLWEFPGGRLKPGETPRAAIRRSLRDELGLEVRVGRPLAAVRHAYTHFRVHLRLFSAACDSPPPGTDDLRWISPAGLADLPLPGANRRLLAALDGAQLPGWNAPGET